MAKILSFFTGWGRTLRISNALTNVIEQFPNHDPNKLQLLINERSELQSENVKKKIIQGYGNRIDFKNVNTYGRQYLSFFTSIFPDDPGEEIKKMIENDIFENFVYSKFSDDLELDPTEISEIVEVSKIKGIEEYNTEAKVRNKLEYYVTNWELRNGIFPDLISDFILQKNEKCVYRNPNTTLSERKQVTKRVSYAGPRARIKIVKGLSYNMGSYNVSAQKELVYSPHGTGTLNLTNKRLLFKSNSKNLTITLSSIIDIEPYSNAVIISKTTGNPLIFELNEANRFYQILNAVIQHK